MAELGDPTENLAADLRKPGRVVAYYLSDGSTARAAYLHDDARPMVLDVMDTLAAAKEAGKLIQVDSIDDDDGHSLELFIDPNHVVSVKVEKAAASDSLGKVA